MKKLFFILLGIGGMAVGLTSCVNEGGNNYQSFPLVPSVVNYNTEMGGTTLLTAWGEIAAPQLSEYNQGDCLMTSFTIDYDNQPSSSYFTATSIDDHSDVINVATAEIEEDSVSVGDYTLPIANVYISPYNNPLFLKGRYFFQMQHQTTLSPRIDYRLVASKKEVDNNGVYNMYLLAKQDKGEGNAVEVNQNQVFVINNMVMTLGRDTTINNSVRVKYLKVNLKYYTQESEETPFKNYGNIELTIYN
ncbi:MAG: hypothetical protein FWF52_11415 [Candidatus Azobacteroides sp.]|nr:hypothetical protein [Candidatus Azobacteroides sp.]